MTNGEKIKEIFPNGVLTSGGNNSYYWGKDILVSKNWWNTEYKKPTTKNDLEEAYNKGYEDGVKSVNICPYCGEYIGEEE